jgi:hypothetical protein
MGSTYTWTIAPKLHTRALPPRGEENATRDDDARSDSASLEPRARVLSPDVSRRARCAKSTAVGAGGVPRRAVRGCARRRGRRTCVWAPTVLLNFPRVALVRFKGQVQSVVSLSRRASWFQRPRSSSPSERKQALRSRAFAPLEAARFPPFFHSTFPRRAPRGSPPAFAPRARWRRARARGGRRVRGARRTRRLAPRDARSRWSTAPSASPSTRSRRRST